MNYNLLLEIQIQMEKIKKKYFEFFYKLKLDEFKQYVNAIGFEVDGDFSSVMNIGSDKINYRFIELRFWGRYKHNDEEMHFITLAVNDYFFSCSEADVDTNVMTNQWQAFLSAMFGKEYLDKLKAFNDEMKIIKEF